jgi:hypothetical protein
MPAAVAPEAMDLPMARKISGAAQRAVCAMPGSAVAAIGGPQAINVVGSFCRALNAGDDATVRATLPTVVVLASRTAQDVAGQAMNPVPNEGFGCPSCFGDERSRYYTRGKKGKRETPFQGCVKFQMESLGAQRSDAEYACQGALQGLDNDEIGMLAALADADFEGLSFGLAGVGADDISAAADAVQVPILALVPAVAAVLAGLWMATH